MHHRLKPGFEADLISLWDCERYGPFPLITCQRTCNHTATAKVITVVVSTLFPVLSNSPTKSVVLVRHGYVLLMENQQLTMYTENMFVYAVVSNNQHSSVKEWRPHAAMDILTRNLKIFKTHSVLSKQTPACWSKTSTRLLEILIY